jgi:hypothetical protein
MITYRVSERRDHMTATTRAPSLRAGGHGFFIVPQSNESTPP